MDIQVWMSKFGVTNGWAQTFTLIWKSIETGIQTNINQEKHPTQSHTLTTLPRKHMYSAVVQKYYMLGKILIKMAKHYESNE